MPERDALGRFLPQNRPSASTPRQIRVVLSAVDQMVGSVITKIVLDTLSNLTDDPRRGGTPVDTGWASSNWQLGVGRRPSGVLGSPDSVPRGEADVGPVLRYTIKDGPVWVANNVPYISRLNDGYSQQAPAGFIQRAVQKAVSDLAT